MALLVDFITSLDGYGEGDGWPGYWGLEGPEYLAWMAEDETTPHTALMGATTYRQMVGHATEHPDDPGLKALTALPKVVFSSSLEEPLAWDNTRLERGDALAAVRALRDSGEELRTLGSVRLVRSLVGAGLVDRLRVVVFPVITGQTGLGPVWAGYPDVLLELVDSRLFDGRLQLLEYVPTVLD